MDLFSSANSSSMILSIERGIKSFGVVRCDSFVVLTLWSFESS